MRRLARGVPAGQLATLGVLITLWLGLSGLLVVTRGQPETFLAASFGRFSRRDAYEHLNAISIVAWSLHSSLVLTAIAATRYRRTDVLIVLMIGPVIASVSAVLGQNWADPSWFQVVAICTIGWLAGTVVGGMYWMFKSSGDPA